MLPAGPRLVARPRAPLAWVSPFQDRIRARRRAAISRDDTLRLMASSRKPRSAAAERPIKDAAARLPGSVRTWLLVILGVAVFLRCYPLTTVPAGIQVDEAMN